MKDRPSRELAEAVRRACLRAALRAHEDAGIQGLCAEGRWEAAVSAIRGVDVGRVVDDVERAVEDVEGAVEDVERAVDDVERAVEDVEDGGAKVEDVEDGEGQAGVPFRSASRPFED